MVPGIDCFQSKTSHNEVTSESDDQSREKNYIRKIERKLTVQAFSKKLEGWKKTDGTKRIDRAFYDRIR